MDVKPCIGCGRSIPDFARVCEYCGYREEVQPRLPSLEVSSDDIPGPPPASAAFDFSADDALEPAQAPVTVESAPEPVPAGSRRRDFTMITLAVVIGGVVTLALLMSRAVPSAEVAAVPVAAPPVKAIVPAASAHTRGWTTANSAVWTGAGSHSVAFELQAENTVPIWMRSVRPMLVVRCESGNIEAFVFTASAARIEPQTNAHTVRFSFDGSADVTEHWADSEEHDALFAPDGASFARRVAGARVMRFGFTPHNAMPVTAEFQVGGLAELIAASPRGCGSPK